jgi:hypothetical protein
VTVDGGAAYGVKGKVYATDKTSQTSNFAYIGTHLLDVEAIANNPPLQGAGAPVAKGEYEVKKSLIFETLSLP